MARLVEPSFRCPVVYIPNFVPDENPDGRIEPASAYYLYVGVLEKHKGLERLAEVAQKMTEDRRFILVGRGSLEGPLQTLAARLPSRVDVRPGVERDTLASLLQHAAAFLMPSIWNENAPLAAIEALSWGVPLLVTSRGGASELVHGGTAGLVIEPTIDGISEGIRTFEDLKDTTPLRRGARQAYETHHRPAPYLNRYLSIVRSLILSRAPVIANHAAEAGSSGGHSSPQEMLVEHGRHDP
jgi:glycosyltransferase involved in cell wall biosynthesis